MAYRELPTTNELLACLWTNDREPEAQGDRILPDACADIVSVGGRLIVAGPATRAHMATTGSGSVFGVRFRVGAAGAGLGLPAAELLDANLPLEDVWGRAAREIAERATDVHELAAAVLDRVDAAPDPLVRAAATGTPRQQLGIGDRQLRRRFADAVGYGPKTLERILRFQRFLRLSSDSRDLARLALEAGYADQAHLTRECGRLAGLTPAQLLATGASPAGERSVSFKTDWRSAVTMAA